MTLQLYRPPRFNMEAALFIAACIGVVVFAFCKL